MRKATTRTAALALLICGAGTAGAAPLNPDDYSSLGALATAAGAYTINTSGTPTLTGPGVNLTGIVVGGVAVFDFDSITIGAGTTIGASGALPLALLSRQDLSVGGSVDVSAPLFSLSGAGGPGASNLGVGGAGQVVQTDYHPYGPSQPYTIVGGFGGGGFGGQGGAGGDMHFTNYSSGLNFVAHGGPGGGGYGDLSVQLQGGSAGGGYGPGGVGLGGGGAIELGAIGAISITGTVAANGGGDPFGNPYGDPFAGYGGGSGGGILIHGNTVTLGGLLSAVGGVGGPSPYGAHSEAIAAGGGGGGGLIQIQTASGGFSGSLASFDVSGGLGGQPGQVVIDPQGQGVGGATITLGEVPEPASVAMLGAGLVGVLVLARRSKGSKAA